MRKLVPWMVLAGAAAAVGAAVRFLPWWGLALALVGAIALGRWLVARRLRQILTAPFKLKGAVLRGATVDLHSAEATEAPGSASDAATPVGPRRYVRLDLTVRPTDGPGGPFTLWEPGELRLVRAESLFDPANPEAGEDSETCSIEALEIQHEGRFQPDEGWKLPGPQRLLLVAALAPGIDRLKFRYYFEEFGDIKLPRGLSAMSA